MKYLLIITALAFAGCASVEVQQGNPFRTSRVAFIRKGETTKAQIEDLFGDPQTRSVGSEGEKWIYFYSTTRSNAQSFAGATSVKTTGTQNRLEVTFMDDIVKEFSYSVGTL